MAARDLQCRDPEPTTMTIATNEDLARCLAYLLRQDFAAAQGLQCCDSCEPCRNRHEGYWLAETTGVPAGYWIAVGERDGAPGAVVYLEDTPVYSPSQTTEAPRDLDTIEKRILLVPYDPGEWRWCSDDTTE